MLPAFAARFTAGDVVLNIGAGSHDYRAAFACRIVTSDIQAGCDEQFPAEAIPYADASVDGVLLMGVFERLDDPMLALREVFRVLRPGGVLLISLLDLGFPWRKSVDRWRVSAGGAAHLVRAFDVVAVRAVDGLAHLFMLQKPWAAR